MMVADIIHSFWHGETSQWAGSGFGVQVFSYGTGFKYRGCCPRAAGTRGNVVDDVITFGLQLMASARPILQLGPVEN